MCTSCSMEIHLTKKYEFLILLVHLLCLFSIPCLILNCWTFCCHKQHFLGLPLDLQQKLIALTVTSEIDPRDSIVICHSGRFYSIRVRSLFSFSPSPCFTSLAHPIAVDVALFLWHHSLVCGCVGLSVCCSEPGAWFPPK